MLLIVAFMLPSVNFSRFQGETLRDTVSSMNEHAGRSEIIGRRVRAIRQSRRMSMKELATETGVTYGYIRAIEVGAKEVTSIDLAERLASALQVSREELIGAESESNERRAIREERERYRTATEAALQLTSTISDLAGTRRGILLEITEGLSEEEVQELIEIAESIRKQHKETDA